MAALEAKTIPKIAATFDDDDETGNYQVTTITVKSSHASKPATELFVVAPVTKGTYPVLLFCHGFMLTNTWYTNLLNHIASHGYILVAPKFYGLISISIPEEIKKAAKVTEWLSKGLPSVLPDSVTPDKDNLALAGHSRGGKTAFALALGRTDDGQKAHKKKSSSSSSSVKDISPPSASPSKFKAIIGIDPVAGTAPSGRPSPKILQYIPRNFNMSVPVAVVGTEYGNQSLGLFPPFAPDGVNHCQFFMESKPPAAYFLTRGYGHCDMLDDWAINLTSYFCKSGKGPKDLMRKSVGGIVVAFLRAYLGDRVEENLNAIVKDPSIAPISLDPIIYVKE